jgi:hypothetical protein
MLIDPKKAINITSGKLKEGAYCEFSYEQSYEADHRVDKITRSPDTPVHNDMRAAFKQLIPHMLIIGEFGYNPDILESMIDGVELEEDEHPDIDLILRYEVSGFKIGGKEDNVGVTIIGHKKLAGNKVMNLVTPFTKMDGEYHYSNALEAALENCQREVEEYLNGKREPKSQLELFELSSEAENAPEGENAIDFSFTETPEQDITAKKKRINKSAAKLHIN